MHHHISTLKFSPFAVDPEFSIPFASCTCSSHYQSSHIHGALLFSTLCIQCYTARIIICGSLPSNSQSHHGRSHSMQFANPTFSLQQKPCTHTKSNRPLWNSPLLLLPPPLAVPAILVSIPCHDPALCLSACKRIKFPTASSGCCPTTQNQSLDRCKLFSLLSASCRIPLSHPSLQSNSFCQDTNKRHRRQLWPPGIPDILLFVAQHTLTCHRLATALPRDLLSGMYSNPAVVANPHH